MSSRRAALLLPRTRVAGALLTGGLLVSACARESLPIALPVAQPPALFRLPPRLARIPPPVPPYAWPDPLQLPEPAVPTWAGSGAAPFAETVHRAAFYYQLPADLIWAVMKVESDFRYRAVSRVGARGLMQLMPRTAAAIGIRDPLDPEQNILAGAYYLRHLANRFGGDIFFTLAAYNAGPGTVRRYGGVPPYPETQAYIRKVLTYYASSTAASL